MRKLAEKLDSFGIGQAVSEDKFKKKDSEVKNEKVGSKVAKSPFIFLSSWGIKRKEIAPFKIEKQQKCLTEEAPTNKTLDVVKAPSNKTLDVEAKLVLSSLERVSKRLDRSICRQELKTRMVSKSVVECEQEVADMERRVLSEEVGIKLLTELSSSLSSQLCKLEPACDSINEVKNQISQIKSQSEGLRERVVESWRSLDELVKVKHNLKMLNFQKRKKTAIILAKSRAHSIRERFNSQEQLNTFSKSINDCNVRTERLTKKLQLQLGKRDQESGKIKDIKERLGKFYNERDGVRRNIVTLKAQRNAAKKKLTSLQKDLFSWAERKPLNLPSLETSSSTEDKVWPSANIAQITDIKTLVRIILDLSQKNSSLKKDLSESTSKLLKLMVMHSTIGES